MGLLSLKYLKIFTVLGLVIGTSAFAKTKVVYDLEVNEELAVYQDADTESPIISRLNRGDKVVVSQKLYDEFRKVLITYRGRPTAGYVLIEKIKRSQIKQRGAEDSDGRSRYSSAMAFGIALVPSYLKQGASTFQLSDGTVYDTTAFESLTYFFSLFMDIPMDPSWGLRTYLSFRETNFRGTATPRGALPGSPSLKVERDQSLTGLGVVAKIYTSPNSGLWWGGGAELAFGKKVSLKLSDVEVPTQDEDKPMFAIAYAAGGFELGFPGIKRLFIVPDLRLGTIVTTKPIMIYTESFLALSYLF